MKKTIKLILLLSFCLSILCGCSVGSAKIVGKWFNESGVSIDVRSDGTYKKEKEYGSGSWKKLEDGSFEFSDFYGDTNLIEINKDEYGMWIKYNGFIYYKDEYPQAKEEDEKASRKADIFAEIEDYKSEGDFLSVKEILNDALREFPDDEEIKNELDSVEVEEKEYNEKIEKEDINNIISEANEFADGGNWDSAIELLEKSQETYKNNEDIAKAFEEIRAKMPITLKNITTVSSGHVDIKKEVVKDRWGNIYDGSVEFNAYYEGYALYNLGKKFKAFKGTIYVPTKTGNESIATVSIYLDEELVYFKDNITVDTELLNVSLNLTDKTTMRIVTSRTDGWDYSLIGFANTSFEKVETVD